MATTRSFATPDEIGEVGEEIYHRRWQSVYEPSHNGQILAIDVLTEDAYLGKDVDEALDRAIAANPDSYFHLERIGFDYVYCGGFPSSYGPHKGIH